MDDTTYTAHGPVTLRGVTKDMSVKGEFLGVSTDPRGGTRAGFEDTTRINRKDFNVNWNQVLEKGGVMVGNHVYVHLELEAIKQ